MDGSAARRLEQIAAVSARDRTLIKARWGASCDMDQGADKMAALVDLAAALDAIDAEYALIGGWRSVPS